ncbi:sigma-B regulation protein RsbQ [Lewinella marina]|uniref:Alpha/beta hydrolase n=1 Tax=Neolewinella marina TaxID=438751 RepID=A0A2G0CG61_9BACT|nr:alpha/beta hydrolase [Neolewinella marina]NJB86586.1 sigma-B regulation protein RsbQ [Neolewinella marina]PHK98963.1 alpha/beta hydrolase [Neolewinella marina]
MSSVIVDHNINESGVPDGQPIVFAHGFGCDQQMWRHVAPHFEDRYRVVLFDYVGAGDAQKPFDPDRYAALDGYADDLVSICEGLELNNIILVSHSVSCMIGVLAGHKLPGRFSKHVMIGPSPHYMNDGNYRGGFDRDDIEELLESLDSNYRGWSSAMAPVIMGPENGEELSEELRESFCRMHPDVAGVFAKATFLSDNREDLPGYRVPTLVLQGRNDRIAGVEVGQYTVEQIPDSQILYLNATGHCPHLSAPDEIVDSIESFL